jgi:multidrug transporter EmrE-like cation transporter
MESFKPVTRKRYFTMNLYIIYILISVLGSALGQLLLKKGMLQLGPLTLQADQLWTSLIRMATNPFVLVGLLIYAAGTVFWLAALSNVDLGFAYSFASLSYIVMLIASWQLFNEHISPLRLIGVFVISLGVLLISRS